MNKEEKVIVGIDPDTDRSGVAVYAKGSKRLELLNLTFFSLFDYLVQNKASIKEVVVEAGWLNEKGNFRSFKKGDSLNARIGKNVGSNHEAGKKIVEMCEYLSIPFKLIKPLRKIWKGADGKITHDEFARITGITKKTNQEQRDAALLVI